MFPDQSPDPSQSNDPQENLDSHSLPERAPSSPQWELNGCRPVSLQVRGMSGEAFQQIMVRLLPEISSSLASYLYTAVEKHQTIDPNEALDSYFNDQYIEVCQRTTYILGDGKCDPSAHKILILRHDDEESLPVELSAPEPGESGINARILFDWLEDDAPWARLDEIGSILGRPDISELFLKSSPEQRNILPSGVAEVSLTPSISLQAVTPDSPAYVPPVEPDRPRHNRWAPQSVQCTSPLYSERNEILSTLMPHHAKEIIASGILNTAENFADNHSLLAPHRLMRAASKLSLPIQVDFHRWICLGEPEEEAHGQAPSDGQDDGSDPDSEIREHDEERSATDLGDDSLFEGNRERQGMLSSEEEEEDTDDYEDSSASETPEEDPADAARDKAIESSVSIQGIPSLLGGCTLKYRTHAAASGTTLVIHEESFDFSAHTLGIEFDEAVLGSPRQAAQKRWGLIERLGDILNTPVHPASINRTLSQFNDDPDSVRNGIDFALGRLAIFLQK